jgi:hypothetical protein
MTTTFTGRRVKAAYITCPGAIDRPLWLGTSTSVSFAVITTAATHAGQVPSAHLRFLPLLVSLDLVKVLVAPMTEADHRIWVQ